MQLQDSHKKMHDVGFKAMGNFSILHLAVKESGNLGLILFALLLFSMVFLIQKCQYTAWPIRVKCMKLHKRQFFSKRVK